MLTLFWRYVHMINIYYCVDKKFLSQQIISLISLVKHCKEPLNVINLTVEIPEYNAKGKKFTEKEDALCESILKSVNPESRYHSIDVSDLFRKHLLRGPNLHNKFYSYYVTVRLLAHLVPEIPDKVLYMDADTIMNGNIKDLYDIDVTDYEIAGRKDLYRISNYFQSGIMLMNMKRIRETRMLERVCDMCASKKILVYIDMTPLNKCCKYRKMLTSKEISFEYDPNSIVHHVCNTRESKCIFSKKWAHRIKTDEVELMRKYHPEYNDIYDKYEEIKKQNSEMFK